MVLHHLSNYVINRRGVHKFHEARRGRRGRGRRSATRNLVEIVDSGTIEVVEVNKPR
jgi:hypothetical protein